MPQGENEKLHSDLHQVSHDLRNWLGAICTYAQTLELSLSKKEMDKERDIAREILECAGKMDALIAEKIDALNS